MGLLAPARRLSHDVGNGDGVERSLSREGHGVAAQYHAHGCGRATQSASTLKSQRREQLDLGGSRIVISGEDQARNAAELRSSWLSQVPGRVTVLWSAILFVAPVLAQPTRDQQHWNNALARTLPGRQSLAREQTGQQGRPSLRRVNAILGSGASGNLKCEPLRLGWLTPSPSALRCSSSRPTNSLLIGRSREKRRNLEAARCK